MSDIARLARLAAAGDLDAAHRLVAVLEARKATEPDEVEGHFFSVEFPDPSGSPESKRWSTKSRSEALKYAQEILGADELGRVGVIRMVPTPAEPEEEDAWAPEKRLIDDLRRFGIESGLEYPGYVSIPEIPGAGGFGGGYYAFDYATNGRLTGTLNNEDGGRSLDAYDISDKPSGMTDAEWVASIVRPQRR